MTADNSMSDSLRQRLDALRGDLSERKEASERSLSEFKSKPVSVQAGLTTREKLIAVREILRAQGAPQGVPVSAAVGQPLPYGKDIAAQKEI